MSESPSNVNFSQYKKWAEEKIVEEIPVAEKDLLIQPMEDARVIYILED